MPEQMPVSGAPTQSQLPPPMAMPQAPQQSAGVGGPGATPQEIENFKIWASQNGVNIPSAADVAGFLTALKNDEPDAIIGAKQMKQEGFPQRWSVKRGDMSGMPSMGGQQGQMPQQAQQMPKMPQQGQPQAPSGLASLFQQKPAGM